MTTAHDLRLGVEQFTDERVKEYEKKCFIAPDLPPLNIPVAAMNETETYAFNYWLNFEHLKYIYMQLKDAQGKRYNASYLPENEPLNADFYVSAFESTSEMCTDEQQQQIEQWIDQHPEFKGIALENMDDYGVDVKITPWSSTSTNTVAVFVLMVSLVIMMFFTIFGFILLVAGTIWVFTLHQQDKKTQQLIELKMWRDTLKSRMESYLEHQIQAWVQKKYALADESEQQMEDDNVKEYEMPNEMKHAFSVMQSNMFVEVEDEHGQKQMKSLAQLKEENEFKNANEVQKSIS
mgnify:CR=1 FL=1